ncbi:pseudouridine synthase [Metabacillus litoralis]|jgi:16S rRNA pseudouridine516 synthase|uniref:pseudouridine synthase n=1 Tax=Metabacillus litoralis TaxID=152268 RepID=UPI00203D0AF3|nr:pseudouridine synthase [Metabacillus litoralis]MCM3650800.1 rRNA pseudouridine synthase [Metabacillus litoralis]
MRIDKLLANIGYGSRKDVKKILKTGVVLADGVVIKDPKTHVNPEEQDVTVNGEKIDYKEFVYLLMNKPAGYLSATEDELQETVIDLLEMEDAVCQPFPVGRLDKDTEGLLLLTNDGQLSHQLLSPKKHVPKTYFATILGEVTEGDIAAFKSGVELDDGYVTKPAILEILQSGNQSTIHVTITEGKYHQVKRMFESVGKKVTYLKRISMGPITLDEEELKIGEYRELTEDEVEALRQAQPIEII